MTDNLRDRIAAALYRHAGESVPNEVPWLSWGETFPVVREVWLSMADAVIAELRPERCCEYCGRTGTQKFTPTSTGWVCRSVHACNRRTKR